MIRSALIAAVALVLACGVARAELPAFTANVVDPQHRLSDDDRAAVEDVIRQLRRIDVWAAVYLPDGLDGDTVDAVANHAFHTWKLGEAGKDNGLLLVLALDAHKMRFEVGYGLESVFPDITCKHVLDEQLRPRLRAGRVADGIIDGLYALARVKDSSFTLENRAPPSASTTRPTAGFDGRSGAWVWGAWILFIAWITFGRGKYGFNNRFISFFFFSVNPGVFIFVGASLLWANRAGIWPVIAGFLLSIAAQAPFYVLVGLAVAYPVRLYATRAREMEATLYHGRPELRALDSKWRRLTGEGRADYDGRAASIVLAVFTIAAVIALGLFLGLDYLQPPYFLVPAGLFWLSMRVGERKLRAWSSPEARTADLEERIRAYEERMNRLVERGHATRNDDGTYAFTAAYYASQRSSSSSDSSSSSWSSSDSSSSSGGGDSGGGGASSDW